MSTETTAERGLVPGSWVETAEGPVVMADTPNKGFAVLTRLPSGQLGFRQLIKLVTRGSVPLVRVVLSSGHAVTVGRDHPFYRVGMEAVPAARLAPGDLLETAYRYPEGYVPPDLPPGTAVSTSVQVVRVEPAGEGEVMTGMVRDTHALFLTAGVLCGE
jgi:hypothetical protein